MSRVNKEEYSAAKQYLRTIRNEQKELQSMKDMAAELRASIYPGAIVYDAVKVQTSPEDRMSEKMAAWSDLIGEIEQHIITLEEKKVEALQIIRKIEESNHRLVLELYYLAGVDSLLTWDQVAKKMNYNRRHVLKLHGSALLDFAEKYKDGTQ